MVTGGGKKKLAVACCRGISGLGLGRRKKREQFDDTKLSKEEEREETRERRNVVGLYQVPRIFVYTRKQNPKYLASEYPPCSYFI